MSFMDIRILMLLVVLIELPIGVVMIVGALKMMRLQSYGWAMTAAILALLPCSPASLLSLAMGIWSLVVLNRRQVKEGFQAQARSRAALRSSPAPSPSAAKSEKTGTGQVSLPEPHLVQAPADCLILAAGVTVVTACGVAIWLLASPASPLITSLTRGNLTVASVTLVTYSLLIGVAGLMLRRLRARFFVLLLVVIAGLFLPAVIALNVAMEFRNMPDWPVAIPLWLGVPAALWGVVTLFRDDVRRAFDAATEQRTGRVAGDESASPQALVKVESPALDSQTGPQPPMAVSIIWPQVPAWYGWVLGGGSLAVVVTVAILIWFDMNPPGQPGAGSGPPKTGESWWGNKGEEHVMFWGPKCPTVSDQLAQHLGLDPSQREAMNQAFQTFFREFKALEEQNTRHETDENGHQITTIAPLQKQLPQLSERFWSELDSVLDGRQLTLGRKTLFLSAGMFNSGDLSYRIEIWRVGQINPWYHWKESSRGISYGGPSSDGKPLSGPDLPEKLRRFWKEPGRPTDAPQSPTPAMTEPDRNE